MLIKVEWRTIDTEPFWKTTKRYNGEDIADCLRNAIAFKYDNFTFAYSDVHPFIAYSMLASDRWTINYSIGMATVNSNGDVTIIWTKDGST